MIAAAAPRGHAFRLRPPRSFRPASGAPALPYVRPLCRSRRPVLPWPSALRSNGRQGGDPGPARLRRLPQSMGLAGGNLGQDRHHHRHSYAARFGLKARRGPRALHGSPFDDSKAMAVLLLTQYPAWPALSCRREHGRGACPWVAPPTRAIEVDGPGSWPRRHFGGPLARHHRAVASAGLVVRPPTPFRVSQRPTRDRLPATDNTKYLAKLRNGSVTARATSGHCNWLFDLMTDARAARSMSPALLLLHGCATASCRKKLGVARPSCHAPRSDSNSPSTRRLSPAVARQEGQGLAQERRRLDLRSRCALPVGRGPPSTRIRSAPSGIESQPYGDRAQRQWLPASADDDEAAPRTMACRRGRIFFHVEHVLFGALDTSPPLRVLAPPGWAQLMEMAGLAVGPGYPCWLSCGSWCRSQGVFALAPAIAAPAYQPSIARRTIDREIMLLPFIQMTGLSAT